MLINWFSLGAKKKFGFYWQDKIFFSLCDLFVLHFLRVRVKQIRLVLNIYLPLTSVRSR